MIGLTKELEEMQTLAEAWSPEEALRWATSVDEFKLRIQGISSTSGTSRDQMSQSVVGTPQITRFGA